MQTVRAVFRWGLALMLMVVSMIAEPLTRAFRNAMVHAVPRRFALPRMLKFSQHQFVKRGHGKILGGGHGMGFALRLAAAAMLVFATVAMFAHAGAFALAIGAVGTLPGGIEAKRRDLNALLGEIEKGQKEMEAGPLSQTRGEELDRKASEALALQAELDAYDGRKALVNRSREVPETNIPADKNERKSTKRIITTPAQIFLMSDGFKAYLASGKQGQSAKVDVKKLPGNRVVLVGDAADAYEAKAREAGRELKAFSSGLLSDLGDDALVMPQTDNEIVRYAEPERQTIRNLLTVSPTTSDSIRFVRHVSTARNAQPQATRGGLKNYLTVVFEPDTVPVENIAVLSKVTEQDLEDAPRLQSIIEDEMTLDIRVKEEFEILWGDGTSGNLDGIFHQGIPEFDRAEGGDTLIDTIRRMRTDLTLLEVSPNGVLVHPLDWEAIELEKGSDSRYVWAVIRDALGARIWSMTVVESAAAENALTGSRRVVVADWKRGATLYDRHDVRLAVGYANDDFERNLRTLRAEERLALALKRSYAFEYSETQAAS